MKRGKKYPDAVKSFDKANQYDVAESISLVKKNATAKFDETIELHIKTGCDGRHANVSAVLFLTERIIRLFKSPCTRSLNICTLYPPLR